VFCSYSRWLAAMLILPLVGGDADPQLNIK
jgi:hypothetical protein